MKQNLTVEFAKANFGKKLSYIAPGYTRAYKGEIIIEGIISNYEGAKSTILADGSNQAKYWDSHLTKEQLWETKNTWVLVISYHKDGLTNYEYPAGDYHRSFYAYCHDGVNFTMGDSDRYIMVEVIE